jgi:glycine/D-amino acid oxidase-like deaminating enzyme
MTSSDYLRDARVVIVGAGAVGAALSYRLAQAGASVTVVERSFPGAGTTGRTFAWLNGMDKPPRDYHRLSIMSIRDHEDLADELDGGWVHVTGSLHWAAARDGGRVAALEQSVRRLIGWGMRVDRLTPEQAVRELEPDVVIDPEIVSSVYLVHRAGWMDAMAMAHGTLRAAVERYGAEVVCGEVVEVRTASGMIEGLVLADGRELEADVVINAAGPDAGRLAGLAGVPLPVERTPGLLLVTAPVPARLRRVVYGPEIHLRPEGGGRVMVQWEPLDSHAVEGSPLGVDDPLVREAMERAAMVLPALAQVEVEAVRLGVRPVPKDGYPIVGFDPAIGNLYNAVTHSGVTLCARLALLVTEELTGGDTAPLEPYRIGRFAASGRGRLGSPSGASD